MAYNSTITRKKCKGCQTNWPKIGLNGFCSVKCMPEEMQQLPKYRKGAVNDRKRAKLNGISKKVREVAKANGAFISPKNALKTKLDEWFESRRNEMQGFCAECGRKINVQDDRFYRWSICHIVPKSLVKSVATDENNWIELCQLHHQELDNTFDKAAKMMCFPEIKQKFQLFKHFIPTEELRKVNPHLLT